MILLIDFEYSKKSAVAFERFTSQMCTDTYAIDFKVREEVSLPNESAIKAEISNSE